MLCLTILKAKMLILAALLFSFSHFAKGLQLKALAAGIIVVIVITIVIVS